jgi:DNA-binding NtrC family response regulator
VALVLCTGIDSDSLENRRLILERAGHRVISATGEQELDSACVAHKIDVVVIGHTLSPKAKERVLTLIRENCPSSKILELYPQDGQKALDEADAWLPMPTNNPQEFAELVTSLTQQRAVS